MTASKRKKDKDSNGIDFYEAINRPGCFLKDLLVLKGALKFEEQVRECVGSEATMLPFFSAISNLMS